MHRKAPRFVETALGKEHPNTLTSTNNLLRDAARNHVHFQISQVDWSKAIGRSYGSVEDHS